MLIDLRLGAPSLQSPTVTTLTKASIVAIAKNESRYIAEWLFYHRAIGFDEMVIYDNDSDDGMATIVDNLTELLPVKRVPWPSKLRSSPQRTAYADAISRTTSCDCDWISFIDIDEFIVPWGYADIKDFIREIPAEASAVAINWLGFGSAERVDDNYGSVIRTFPKCSNEDWANNKHFKTIARKSAVCEVFIHDVRVSSGEKVASDFSPAKIISEGKLDRPVYGGIQVNHYQVKTYTEYRKRMLRGNANFPPGHPQHERDGTHERFLSLDQNERTCEKILPFAELGEILRSDLYRGRKPSEVMVGQSTRKSD